jgi:uncharacterized protein YbjT (DUF2867 family)
MNQPILITGGSGTLGRAVVERLLAAGHAVRVLSRRPRPASVPAKAEWITGDLLVGDGLAGAVAGVAAVVHCASDPRRPRVDVDGTRKLIEAARAAGTPHLVDISIVGVDRVPYRYYQAKLAAERLIQASGLPWTILRHPLPPAGPAGRRGTGPAAAGAGPGRHQLPADRRRRGRRTAGRARRRARERPGARHRRPADPDRHRPAARLPARGRAAPAGPAGPRARRRVRRLPARRPPHPRPRGRAPHLGGVPGRTG